MTAASRLKTTVRAQRDNFWVERRRKARTLQSAGEVTRAHSAPLALIVHPPLTSSEGEGKKKSDVASSSRSSRLRKPATQLEKGTVLQKASPIISPVVPASVCVSPREDVAKLQLPRGASSSINATRPCRVGRAPSPCYDLGCPAGHNFSKDIPVQKNANNPTWRSVDTDTDTTSPISN